MRARYVVTSTCIQSGTIRLTLSLRQMLSGRERITCQDEEGEQHDCTVDWVRGVLDGLEPYFAKRRLQVNDVIWLTLDGEVLALEAAAARKVRPRPVARPAEVSPPAEKKVAVPVEAKRPQAEPPETPSKRVRVTPHAGEKKAAGQPAYVRALEALELKHTPADGYDRFRAYLGRREYTLILGRYGEVDAADLLALRRTGQADHAGWVVAEALLEKAASELGGARLLLVSPEALAQLVALKKLFPVGPVELERLLRDGRVDAQAVSRLADEVRRWVGERAAFSAVLLALAEYNRQQVFFAEDVLANLGEGSWDRETVWNVLEALAGPPFLLLEKSGSGEYLLREPVADNLAHLAEYALSLRSRLVAEPA
ncbi:MAG TPA: hypothetical protein ENK37_01485 [Oceanithermus profundus]|uniref:DUF4388 domain-containing protein n=1 Tax=Oceanithermus profundus TaxID=187137 RepID=A0A7C4Z7T0_9DEIN|nr:hypothetical protein [Oceanithermus profundus]